jgi:hypothetical protein
MPDICAEIITAPFLGAPDYHLMSAERAAGVESFLFTPQSDAPGLTIDLIRLDLVPRRFQRLQDMFAVLLSQQISYAGPERVQHEILSSSPTEILFHFSFNGHPLAGAQHTIGRLIDYENSILGIQVLRKIEALTSDELSARIDFVHNLHVDLAALEAKSANTTEFIQACLANTARIDAIFRRISEGGEAPDDMAALQLVLSQASPLRETIEWSSLAKFVALDILERGRVEEFAAARRMLGLAALNLDDGRGLSRDGSFFVPQIINALDPLAELLLYDTEGDYRAHAQRAAGIWRRCMELEGANEPERAAQFEVMATFAEALVDMDLSAPLDAGLGHATAAALQDKKQVEQIVSRLHATASRMAHLGRQSSGGQVLRLGSCLAADLSQFLVERATALGFLDFETFTAKSISISKWQLDAQLALYGLTWADLDPGVRKAEHPFSERPALVFLRQLGTARRELLPNRFPASRNAQDKRYRLLPGRISIEAALQVELTPSFTTRALGGPIDLFGMGRGTVLGGGADSWQGMAKLMIEHSNLICVLPADSEGLSWELAEILRQNAAQKTMFVLPPGEAEGAPALSAAARERLGAIGFKLPERSEPGFILLSADGSYEQHIPFDWLWNGRLNTRLCARLRMVPR